MDNYVEMLKHSCQIKSSVIQLELLKIEAVKAIAASNNNEALRSACRNKMPEVALKLLEIKAVKALAAVNKNEALRSACRNKLPEVALKLLEIDPVIHSLTTHCNKKNGFWYKKYKFILKNLQIATAYVNIDERDNVLFYACYYNMPLVALKILQIKAAKAIAAKHDNAALRYACENNMPEVALNLLKIKAVKANAAAKYNRALIAACLKNMSEVALKLLEIKAVKANAAEYNNDALGLACKNNMPEVALKLLQIKAVKAMVEADSTCSILWACWNNMLEVALKLSEIGAVANNVQYYNSAALIAACQSNMPEVALNLLEIEAVKAKAAADSNRALIWACQNNMPEVALNILKIEAVKANAAAESNSALLWACQNNMPKVALKLLEIKSVKANAAANNNAALNSACNNNMPEVATKLLEIDKVRIAVKTIAAVDKQHKLLIMACKIHHFEIVQEIFALPNLVLDLIVLQTTLPKEDTSDLEWHLALLQIKNPEHPIAQKLTMPEQISLQKRLCQEYRNLYHNYLQERLPIELLDNILIYTKLHPQLKHLSEQDRPLKVLLSVLSRSVLLHQSLSILTGLRESKNEELLQGLLKQAAMQAEIVTALDQFVGPEDTSNTQKTIEMMAWKQLGIDFDTWGSLKDFKLKIDCALKCLEILKPNLVSFVMFSQNKTEAKSSHKNLKSMIKSKN